MRLVSNSYIIRNKENLAIENEKIPLDLKLRQVSLKAHKVVLFRKTDRRY